MAYWFSSSLQNNLTAMIYRIAKHKMEYHEYDDSIVLFEIISDYQDSDELLSKCKEKLENEKEK